MRWSIFYNHALIITIIIVIASYILNIFLGEAVFVQGIKFIIEGQRKTTGFVNFIQNAIISLCDPLFILGVLLLLYISSRRKISILVFSSFILSVLYVNTISRNLLRSPRPFWITPSIANLEWSCRQQYNNPSIHTIFIFPVYQPLFFDVLTTRSVTTLSIIIPSILTVVVPVICFYLGSESLNQIILGTLLGISYLCLYRYKLQKLFYKIYFFLFRNKTASVIGIITILNLIVFLLPVVLYQIQYRRQITDYSWKQIIQLTCRIRLDPRDSPLNITESFYIQFIFGSLVASWLAGEETENYLMGQWIYHSEIERRCIFISKIIRICLELIVVIGLVAVIVLSWSRGMYLRYLTGCACSWLMGLILNGGMAKILLKSKIIAESNYLGDVSIKKYYDC